MFLVRNTGPLAEPLSGRRWTSAEIRRQVSRRTSLFAARGMGPCQRVFLHHGNCLEFFADLLAVWSLGACAIPVDQRLTPFEVKILAAAAEPRFSLHAGGADRVPDTGATVIDSRETDSAPPGPEADPWPALDDDALILFTSGTTGDPKGVVHTHRSLRARWTGLHQSLGVEAFERTLCLLPTHFGHGLICNSLYAWLSGRELFILPPFRPQLMVQLSELIDEHRITFLSSVPSVWRLALEAAEPPAGRSLLRVFCGSAPLTANLWERVREWTSAPEVWNAYGITETGSWVAGTNIGSFTPEDGLIGQGWGSIVRVLREGSTDAAPSETEDCAPGENGYVWLKTPALMKGYFRRDDLTREVVRQGWFLTGDIGCLDERGLLYLKGREREEINKGGQKIYPGDVDGMVEQFTGVSDVAAFAVEDPLFGQDVGLAVVLESPEDRVIRDLHDFLSEHLAQHQMPVKWWLVDEIPRTSRGKINRARVAEACSRCPPLDLDSILANDR